MIDTITRDQHSHGPTGPPSFDLWHEPWIGVIDPSSGGVRSIGIGEALTHAHLLGPLQDGSPLVITGTHRLLTAIAQALYTPTSLDDVAATLQKGMFDADLIGAFELAFGHRFDLFSPVAPFLQTSDIPLSPSHSDAQTKPISYLFMDIPSATNIAHFNHRGDAHVRVCPGCAASGLVTIPAFATSGGAGIKPSINGVPPLYVLPNTPTLFESLALSVVAPDYQPESRSGHDEPLWTGDTVIPRNGEVADVGYVQSLLFPARRVRLFPEGSGRCTRCGIDTPTLVRRMVFEMGLARPKDAAWWRDPFAAYNPPKDKPPVPLRPREGRSVWRDYPSLVLSGGAGSERTIHPAVVEQAAELRESTGALDHDVSFRCIGLRTDMKAKIFEWVDATVGVPVDLLGDSRAARTVEVGLSHAESAGRDINFVFRNGMGPDGSTREQYQPERRLMMSEYWTGLTASFREFISMTVEDRDAALAHWDAAVLRIARRAFDDAVEAIGDRGADLRKRVRATQHCSYQLGKLRKEWLS